MVLKNDVFMCGCGYGKRIRRSAEGDGIVNKSEEIKTNLI